MHLFFGLALSKIFNFYLLKYTRKIENFADLIKRTEL